MKLKKCVIKSLKKSSYRNVTITVLPVTKNNTNHRFDLLKTIMDHEY